MVLGGLPADLGVGAGAEAPGEFTAHIELDVGVAHEEGLRIGVDRDELDALETDLDHPVDGVDTTAADTDDLDDCEVVLRCCHVEGLSPRISRSARMPDQGRTDGCRWVGSLVPDVMSEMPTADPNPKLDL